MALQPPGTARSGSKDESWNRPHEQGPLMDWTNILQRFETEPKLKYLGALMQDPRLGNNAYNSRQRLARDAIILERNEDGWHGREWKIGHQPWDAADSPRGYAIVMNYLDSEALQSITALGINVKAFRAHIDGCEQHYTGTWWPSHMTSPPYLRTEEHDSRFVSFDYRRRYKIRDRTDLEAFEVSRLERCTLLRSHHLAPSAGALFEHERCTIAWNPASEDGLAGMSSLGG
ncbi:MAG: hypothetical protein Q9195_008332 [Heterodermia aff. obscurata]